MSGHKTLTKPLRTLGIPADYAQTRGLRRQREATRLVAIGGAPDDGNIIRLTPPAAAAWQKMQIKAARDRIALVPLSGFRSVARQTKIIRAKLSAGLALADILRVIAAPGFSEHHTGRAIDIGSRAHTVLEESFEHTDEFRWLTRHAKDFGFRLSYPRANPHGIAYEPWHWCWHA